MRLLLRALIGCAVVVAGCSSSHHAGRRLVYGPPDVRVVIADPAHDRLLRLTAAGDLEVSSLRTDGFVLRLKHIAARGGTIAFDAHDDVVYGQDPVEDVVTRYDLGNDAWMTPIGVGKAPRTALAVADDGAFVFCGDGGSKDVAVIAIRRNALSAGVPVGGVPRAIAVSGADDLAFVALPAPELTVIDPRAPNPGGLEATWPRVVGHVGLAAPATALAATHDGKLIVAVEPAADQIQIVAPAYRAALGAVHVNHPTAAAIAADDATAYVEEADGTIVVIPMAGFRITHVLREPYRGPFAVAPDV